MKKILSALVLVVAVAALVGPYYAGLKAEKELHKFIAKLDGYPGYEFAWEDYDRSWFSTRATLAVGFDWAQVGARDDDSTVPPLPVLPVAVFVEHGPVLIKQVAFGWYAWRIRLTDEQTTWLEQRVTTTTDEPLFKADGRMGLLGAVNHRDELQPFRISDEEAGTLINVQGYGGQLTINRHRQLKYDGIMQGMDFSAEDALVALNGMSIAINGDLARIHWDTLIYPSDFFIKIDSAHVQGEDQTLELTHAVLEGALELARDAQWFNVILSTAIGGIRAPGVQVDNAALTLAYERISLSAYKAYIDMSTATMRSGEADFASFFTPEVMREFFAHNPAFVLRNASFSTPNGNFKADFALAMKEGFALPDPLLNPMVFLQALVFKADARLDKPLAEYLAKQSALAQAEEALADNPDATEADVEAAAAQQVRVMLDMLIAQGVLVEDGEDLATSIRFLDGQLLLNGNPVPLPLGMLMGGHPPAQP